MKRLPILEETADPILLHHPVQDRPDGGMTFEDSFFGCADMKNASFEDVDLSGAHFVRVDFTDAVFEDCTGFRE